MGVRRKTPWARPGALMSGTIRDHGQMLEVKVGADNVEYALLKGDCLVIRHETEQIQLTPEHPVAVRPVSKRYGKT